MTSLRKSLRSKIHDWTDKVGFRLNSTNTIKDNSTVDHYFFKTFNFIEKRKSGSPADKSEFVCFDTYGEKVKVRSLLDLQSAFFENLSELR